MERNSGVSSPRMHAALGTDDLRESANMQWESEALVASKVTKHVSVLPHRDATCSRRLISPQSPSHPPRPSRCVTCATGRAVHVTCSVGLGYPPVDSRFRVLKSAGASRGVKGPGTTLFESSSGQTSTFASGRGSRGPSTNDRCRRAAHRRSSDCLGRLHFDPG
jgi:hypothetical protein